MKNDVTLKIREYNRFYLTIMDLYTNSYLDSDYSITQSRVLYEIYENSECSADYIAKKLHLDKGYLSRIIKGFENNCIVYRRKSEIDARFYKIILTKKGIKITEELIEKANEVIGSIVKSLSERECMQLKNALNTAEEILQKGISHENYTV